MQLFYDDLAGTNQNIYAIYSGRKRNLDTSKTKKKITAKQGTVGAKEIFTPYTSKEHIYKSNV